MNSFPSMSHWGEHKLYKEVSKSFYKGSRFIHTTFKCAGTKKGASTLTLLDVARTGAPVCYTHLYKLCKGYQHSARIQRLTPETGWVPSSGSNQQMWLSLSWTCQNYSGLSLCMFSCLTPTNLYNFLFISRSCFHGDRNDRNILEESLWSKNQDHKIPFKCSHGLWRFSVIQLLHHRNQFLRAAELLKIHIKDIWNNILVPLWF